MKKLFSFLGAILDKKVNRSGAENIWRPSLAVLDNTNDIHFDEYHIVWQSKFSDIASDILQELRERAGDTKIIDHEINLDDPWDFEEVYGKLFDLAEELNFQSEKDENYIHITTGTHVMQITLFLLNESHHLRGKLLQSQPDETEKHRSALRIIDLDLARYDKIASRFDIRKHESIDFLKSGIKTENAAFNKLIETVEKVAVRSVEPILLTGPTGAGKSQLAKQIYALKKKNNQLTGAFVDVNCATLRGDQAMSTLFGHKKGAFTGAAADRAGLLMAADKGMLFLDEIGELGLDEQAMLLRAVEEKVFLPLGADTESCSSFQLICGTNRDLKKEVKEGRFRADLLERINLWAFRLPGLADRREDIQPNIAYELERFYQKNGHRITFNAEAFKIFMEYALDNDTRWEGNFRELNSIIVRLGTLAPSGRIDKVTVRDEIERCRENCKRECADDASEVQLPADFETRYDPFDIAQLKYTIKICQNSKNISEAGRKLFAVSRTQRKTVNDTDRLTKYLAKFNLTFDHIKNGNLQP